MKIEGWRIDRFGGVTDRRIDGLSPGLTVIHGPNEAGKSSALWFLRAMLFGYRRRNQTPSYHPVDGSARSGRLLIVDGKGRHLTVERTDGAREARIRDATGAELPPATVDDLLGGVGYDVFASVFAFDLDDVREVGALRDGALGDRLFSAGVVGAGRAAETALGGLDERRQALLRPSHRGSNQLILELRTQLREAGERLAVARADALGLGARRAERAAVAAGLAELERQLDRLRGDQVLVEGIVDLWPLWERAAEARRALAGNDPVPDLPAGFIDLLDDAVGRAAGARDRLAAANQTRESARAQAAAPEDLDTEVLGAADRIEALVTGSAVAADRALRLADADATATDTRSALDGLLARLGPDVAMADLDRLPDTVETSAHLRHRAGALSSSRTERIAADEAAEATRRGHTDRAVQLERRLTEVRRAAGRGPGPARLRWEALVSLRAALDAVAVTPTPVVPPGPPLSAWVPSALIAAAVVLVVVGAMSVAAGAALASALSVLVAAVLGGLAIVLRSSAGPADEPVHHPAMRSREEADADRLIALLSGRWSGDPSELRSRPRVAVLEAKARRELDAAERLATEQATLTAEAMRLVDDAREAEVEVAQAQLAARDAEIAAAEQWRQALEAVGLPTTLDDTAVRDVLSTVRDVRSAAGQLRRSTVTQECLLAERENRRRAVLDAAQAIGEPVAADAPVEPLVDRLARRLEDARRAEARLAETATALTAADHASAEAAAAVAREDRALQALFDRADATDVDTARQVALAVEERRTHDAALAELDSALAHRFGASAVVARARLAQADPARWEVERTTLAERTAAARTGRDDSQRRLAELDVAIEAVESSVDVAQAELDVERITADLTAAAEEWVVLGLARGLVQETLNRYRREQQPEVVQRAGRWFSAVTAGRYPEIRIGSDGVKVMDRSGRERNPAELSRGTVEQLYLCLRLALAQAFAATTAPLPLVLDDVLVNVDPARAVVLAGALGEVARTHQVLLFTCQPSQVDLITLAVPSAEVRHLDGPETASRSSSAGALRSA